MNPGCYIMKYEDFKYYLGETIEYCQTIEHDIKWIYSVMLKGDCSKTFESISNQTLGKVINELKKLDHSDNNQFLSDDDYSLLKSITEERNYLVHQIYRDFIYKENCFESKEYKKASNRLMNFHNRLKKLQENIEQVRLNAVKTYRIN